MSQIGDNQPPNGQLRAFVERIESVNEEASKIAEARKEIFAEAKATGFDVKTLRKLIAERKKDKEQLEEERALLALYEANLEQAIEELV